MTPKYIEALKYGLIGLGFLLALLSFWLLTSEQRKSQPRTRMLRSIYIFMGFSLLVLGFGLFAETPRSARSAVGRVLPEETFAGRWSVAGEDLDFPDTRFTARNTYRGEMDMSVSGSTLSFTSDLETHNKQDDTLKGVARFAGQGPISNSQVSAYYDYTNERVAGFGTAFMQFDYAGKEAVAYLVFRVTTGEGTIGQAKLRMTRK